MAKPAFLDIHEAHANKAGEELCGDTVKLLRTEGKTILVLSDGLGSGVKANILATMTAEILVTMLSAGIGLSEVIDTVIRTLPVCRFRQLAYATFTVLEVDHASSRFTVVNFDNPPIVYLHEGKLVQANPQVRQVLDRKITFVEGTLTQGDCLALLSDGTLYAGLGKTMNFGWGWENVALYLRDTLSVYGGSAREVSRRVLKRTAELYRDEFGDDATFVTVLARDMRSLMIFTGPPLEQSDDQRLVQRLLTFEGRKVVCGGTTGNIVAAQLGCVPEVDIATLRPDVPPIARVPGVDLMTEGILTMTKALEYLKAGGEGLPMLEDTQGAAMLAKEMQQADRIHFLVGQRINEYYQNPALPPELSLRKNLIKEYAQFLEAAGKQVTIEYC